MSLTIEEKGVVFDTTERPKAQRVCCFTSLCPTSTGAILCAFQVGEIKQSPTSTIQICRSRDNGRTWQELSSHFERTLEGIPGSLVGAELVETEPGRLLLFTTWFDRSDPQRPLFDPVTEGILHSRQLMAVSTDDGETFTDWERLATAGLAGCATTGPVLKFPDGRIAFAFESFKEFDDPKPARHGAWLLTSKNGGRTFEEPLLVAQDPEDTVYYWDQRLCNGPGVGEFFALFWTHDRKQKKDLRVHFKRGSIDGQPATADIVETGIPGQIAAPLWIEDDRLLAFVVDREKPATMKLWVSTDQGHSWPEQDALVVHAHDEKATVTQGLENIDFNQYWEDMGKWSFGHPAIRLLGDGRVLVAYYAGTPERMSVHWARIRI